tara:strand:+ start:605 stop:793 length:189 start_codon:yes stop_codon:yes gene_type:complete
MNGYKDGDAFPAGTGSGNCREGRWNWGNKLSDPSFDIRRLATFYSELPDTEFDEPKVSPSTT